MGENTKIEWCDHTWNGWIGCTKVSDGCKHCYAETLMDKRYGRVEWGPQGTRQRTSEANWRKPEVWNRRAKAEGRRYKVFCASLADVFEDRPELIPWRADLFRLIDETPNLDWLVLTKRPELVNQFLRDVLNEASFPPNVWIGTSVEDQKTADERIPHLLSIPASVRFLSMEPLLGAVDLTKYQPFCHTLDDYQAARGILSSWISWVIVGGDSGPHARPMHPDWVRSIRDQCVDAGVPFFFKQWGEWLPSTHVRPGTAYGSTHVWAWPWASNEPGELHGDTTMMVRLGKKAAGRILDGQEWSQFPQMQVTP